MPDWLYYSNMPRWAQQLLPIVVLLTVIVLVLSRLPKVELETPLSDRFRRRRVANWLPLGMTYAFLYFGRYNLAALKIKGVEALTEQQYGDIFFVGALVYGFAFLINGPLTDRLGGRKTILIAAAGAAAANAAMGLLAMHGPLGEQVTALSILYGANMYFQSFGAVSIVKVNAHWFHVRERGVLGGMFGILISLGVYFAFDWGRRISVAWPHDSQWVFLIPAAVLALFLVIDFFIIRDSPSRAGFDDFDVADASSGDVGPRRPALEVIVSLLKNPIIITIAIIEFCSGFLRNAIMHWYPDFASSLGLKGGFVYQNWGMLLCVAGITGGMFAGVLSDRLFDSRRGPVAGLLYGLMLAGAVVLVPLLGLPSSVGWMVVFMSMAIIGVHGMLSGTASADFGGKNNAGIAVGLIDGCVYLGTALQSIVLGNLLPSKESAEAASASAWKVWPYAMVPLAVIGLVLCIRVWHARPQPKVTTAVEPG